MPTPHPNAKPSSPSGTSWLSPVGSDLSWPATGGVSGPLAPGALTCGDAGGKRLAIARSCGGAG